MFDLEGQWFVMILIVAVCGFIGLTIHYRYKYRDSLEDYESFVRESNRNLDQLKRIIGLKDLKKILQISENTSKNPKTTTLFVIRILEEVFSFKNQIEYDISEEKKMLKESIKGNQNHIEQWNKDIGEFVKETNNRERNISHSKEVTRTLQEQLNKLDKIKEVIEPLK